MHSNLATSVAVVVTSNAALRDVVEVRPVGTESMLTPAKFRIRATPAQPDLTAEPAPTVQPWPTATGVTLAAASNCVIADSAKVGELLAAANQLSYFTEPDSSGVEVTYELAAVALLPGDAAC